MNNSPKFESLDLWALWDVHENIIARRRSLSTEKSTFYHVHLSSYAPKGQIQCHLASSETWRVYKGSPYRGPANSQFMLRDLSLGLYTGTFSTSRHPGNLCEVPSLRQFMLRDLCFFVRAAVLWYTEVTTDQWNQWNLDSSTISSPIILCSSVNRDLGHHQSKEPRV